VFPVEYNRSEAVSVPFVKNLTIARVADAKANARMSFKVLTVTFVSTSLLVANAVTVIAADGPPAPKPAAPGSNSPDSFDKPLIVQNSDGTFTIQKKRPNRNSNDAKIEDGLVIPPQVIVPEFPAKKKKR
jgi:hypothetical protein